MVGVSPVRPSAREIPVRSPGSCSVPHLAMREAARAGSSPAGRARLLASPPLVLPHETRDGRWRSSNGRSGSIYTSPQPRFLASARVCCSMNVTSPGGNPEAARAPQFVRDLYELRPWYHDFSALGLDTTFLQVPLTLGERLRGILQFDGTSRPSSIRDIFRRSPSSHVLNQRIKEKHLIRLLTGALSELEPRPVCLELFCADGYYSCRLATLAPGAEVTAVDLDPEHIQRAETIARYLRLPNLTFL